ncbi:hypothetical protein FRC14_007905, partial [Serendipita sp. 396]
EAWVPAGLPTYTTGLFVFALLTRLCFFSPWSYWARRRKWKIKEEVVPRLLAEAIHGWTPPLRAKLTRQNVPKSIQQQIVNENMIIRKKELEKQLKCTVIPTILVPTLFTLPAFVISTSIAYSVASAPEILSNIKLDEMFLLPFQEYPPILPFAIAVVGLLNVEIGTWSPKSLKSMRDNVGEKEAEVAPKPGQKEETLEVKPGAIAVSFYRAINVGRGVICLTIPGTVHILWFTSSVIGLFESLIFNIIERSRSLQLWERNSPMLQLRPKQLEKLGIDLSPVAPLERLGKANYSRSDGWTVSTRNTPRSMASNSILRPRSINGPTAGNAPRRSFSSVTSRARPAMESVKSSGREMLASFKKSRTRQKDRILDWMKEVVARNEEYELEMMGKVRNVQKEKVMPTEAKGPPKASPTTAERRKAKLWYWLSSTSPKARRQRKSNRKSGRPRKAEQKPKQPTAPYFVVLKREVKRKAQPEKTSAEPPQPKGTLFA